MRLRLLIILAFAVLPVMPGTATATRAAGRWAEHTAVRALHHRPSATAAKASSVRRTPWKRGPHQRLTVIAPKKATAPAPRLRPRPGTHDSTPAAPHRAVRSRAGTKSSTRLRLRSVTRARSVHRLNEVDLK